MTVTELNKYGELAVKYWELKALCGNKEADNDILQQIKNVDYRLSKINSFISGCPDPFIKEMMIYKFTQMLSWESVANKIGGYNSAGSCRMLVNRYIERYNRGNIFLPYS